MKAPMPDRLRENRNVKPRYERRSFTGRTMISFAELGLAEVPMDSIAGKERQLHQVDLSNNAIDLLPVELAQMKEVTLDGNPLALVPKDTRSQPWNVIRQWLKGVADRAKKWKTVKLIVVGEENVGMLCGRCCPCVH